MKQFFFLLLFLFLAAGLQAQRDTAYTSVEETADTLETQPFWTEDAFYTGQSARWAIKGFVQPTTRDILDLGTQFRQYLIWLGGEIKLASFLSINLETGTTLAIGKTAYASGGVSRFDLRFEPRWYYRQPSRIRSGKSANNLSDNYFSVYRDWIFLPKTADGRTIHSYGLSWGFQRRLLNYGFADISLFAAREHINSPYGRPQFAAGLRKRYGFALWPSRGTNACAATRCFVEEQSMLRVNLADVLELTTSKTATRFNTHVGVEWEQKAGRLPLSLTGGLGLSYGYEAITVTNPDGNPYNSTLKLPNFDLSLEPRYYHNLMRQVRRGRSANNLSGLYVGVGQRYNHFYANTRSQLGGQPETKTSADFNLRSWYACWGLQQRIHDHAYFGVRAEYGYREVYSHGQRQNKTWYFNFPVSAGIAF
jgi:hypothetical protein